MHTYLRENADSYILTLTQTLTHSCAYCALLRLTVQCCAYCALLRIDCAYCGLLCIAAPIYLLTVLIARFLVG